MDPQPSYVPVNNDDSHKDVSSSSSVEERSFTQPAQGVTLKADEKENRLVERVQGIALESSSGSSSSKTEWTTSTASIHLTTNVSNKAGMFEEEEEGELDYEEDEGEIAAVQEDRNGMKNDTDGDKEEGELEEDEQEEGEEGEILSDEDNKAVTETKTQEKQDLAASEADGPEEGEVIEEGVSSGGLSLRKKVCRYFQYGGCTWGMSCRFLHPGLNDKGAYQMLPVPGQYPSPFPKPPAVVPQVPSEAIIPAHGMPPFPDHEEQIDEMIIPEVAAPQKKETAWERGLKLAKEIKKAAQKRKEEDADFEEKRMILGITAEEDDDENDKENLTRRREMMRSRLEKDTFEEDDARYRRGGDIVSRWRPTSPVQYRERDRRKRRVNRSPSSSPERDRRSRRRAGEKEKLKGKAKETTRDKERTKKTAKEAEGKREEKIKKQKEKGSESGKVKPALEEEKREVKLGEEKNVEDKEQINVPVKQQEELKSQDRKAEDEKRKLNTMEKSADIEVKATKEADRRLESNDGGSEEKDKPKTKALGISSSRLPNDEWMDPWQRTTSPKRRSVSSASSRSRSSSSSSDSSRSSRSRSGSESRSTSRSASRSRSRSVSQTPSRSPSRSRSGSRSKSRSRSGSVSSASDHSSSSSSKSPPKEVKTTTGEGGEEKSVKQASHHSSESDSDSESESNKSSSKSPTPVPKSPVKPKTSPDRGPRTPPVESSYNRNAKDRRNRFEYGRTERTEKWHEAQMGQGSPWNRRQEGARPVEDHHRDRGYHSRRRKSPDRRRRSRSPRARNEDRRRLDETRTRERSSSADSMEHALARPSSPRTARERGGMRRGSSASSSGSESASSDTGSESEEERNPVRTRRAGPETDQVKRNVLLTSGNIRYTGHKDIKLTLNKSVSRPDRGEPSKPPSQYSPPERTEASSSSEKQLVAKKRPRDPSPVVNASNHAKEAVTSSVTTQPANKPDKRSADSQAEAGASGKPNTSNTSSRREELLRELKAVEDAIARKRARIE